MRSSEVAGIPCLAYPNLSHDTQSTKSKDGNYQNKHESNNNHQKLEDILFGSVFEVATFFLLTQHTYTWRSSPHWGDHHKSSSTKPWMRSSQHPAELLTQGHWEEKGPRNSIYYWPNGIMPFHLHLDFPEIRGFPLRKTTTSGKSVMFEVAMKFDRIYQPSLNWLVRTSRTNSIWEGNRLVPFCSFAHH